MNIVLDSMCLNALADKVIFKVTICFQKEKAEKSKRIEVMIQHNERKMFF